MAGHRDLPFVLAGPIVRRVEPRRCSFWIALRDAADVTALVYDGPMQSPGTNPLAQATAPTIRVGQRLHVVVVTITLPTGVALQPARLYSYDLRFSPAPNRPADLAAAGLLQEEKAGSRIPGVDPKAPLHRPLGFDHNSLPTFVMPPSNLADLRIAHMSCRRPGAARAEAFAGLAEVVADPARRPHQLVLSGDQIYADDVATPMLVEIGDLGVDLLRTDATVLEEVAAQPVPVPGLGVTSPLHPDDPDPALAFVRGTLDNLPPRRRERLIHEVASMTTEDAINHLITLPEYAAHYLLAWSSRVWRDMPRFEDAFGPSPANTTIDPWLTQPWKCKDPEMTPVGWGDRVENKEDFEGFNRSAHQVARSAGGVSRVAQVLANTPTYMVFDDHDVTDDWNLNRRWEIRVHSRQLGRFILRNALVAYGLFQGWGNDPQAFAGTTSPGAKLLAQVPGIFPAGGDFSNPPDAALDEVFGFDEPRETPSAKRIRWHYSVDSFVHRLLVLDTRTHRTSVGVTIRPPNLLGSTLNTQVAAGPLPVAGGQEVLVVVSAAPVVGPIVIDRVGQALAAQAIDIIVGNKGGYRVPRDESDEDKQRRRNGCAPRKPSGSEKYDLEGWSANEEALEAFLARLATYPSVVLLGGDVHFACTMTLDYWRKGVAQPSRLVQCTSSPAKNLFKDVVEDVIRRIANLQRAQQLSVERLAWKTGPAPVVVPTGAHLAFGRRTKLRRSPALLPSGPWPPGTTLPTDAAKLPDWRWRLSPVSDTETTVIPPRPQLPSGLDAETDVLKRFGEIASLHARLALEEAEPLRTMLFTPNFGVVSFRDGVPSKEVVHTLFTAQERLNRSGEEDRPTGFPPFIPFVGATVHHVPLRTPPGTPQPDIRHG